MLWLLKYIRPLTYAGVVVFGIAIVLYAKIQTSIPIQQQGLLIKYFANTSVLFLYFTLLASPLYATFPKPSHYERCISKRVKHLGYLPSSLGFFTRSWHFLSA